MAYIELEDYNNIGKDALDVVQQSNEQNRLLAEQYAMDFAAGSLRGRYDLTKAFAMTGWRLGYAVGPELIVRQMTKIHQFAIMCAPTTSQMAAIEALRAGDEDIEEMKAEYNRRRTHLVARLRKMGLSCFTPEGAFYVFPNIAGFGLTSEEFCEKLLLEYGVAIVPGTAFGACGEGFARISYAYSLKHIDAALDRMERMIGDLRSMK